MLQVLTLQEIRSEANPRSEVILEVRALHEGWSNDRNEAPIRKFLRIANMRIWRMRSVTLRNFAIDASWPSPPLPC